MRLLFEQLLFACDMAATLYTVNAKHWGKKRQKQTNEKQQHHSVFSYSKAVPVAHIVLRNRQRFYTGYISDATKYGPSE